MMSKANSIYYAERLASELKALETATNEVAKSAHRELADHYAELLAIGEAALATPQPVSEAGVNS